VFTTAFAIEKQLLFYTIALPIVDTLNSFGIPTFLRYDTTGTKYAPCTPESLCTSRLDLREQLAVLLPTCFADVGYALL
jgi:hypothetical protein